MLVSTVMLSSHSLYCQCKFVVIISGMVLADPEIPVDATLIPSPSPRPKNPVFDDEKKSKVRSSFGT